MVVMDRSGILRTKYIEGKIIHTHKTESIVGTRIGGLISMLGIALLAFGLTGQLNGLFKLVEYLQS